MFSGLNQAYLVPDKTAVSDLTVALRKIGTNINQIAHHTNRTKSLGLFDAKQLRQKVIKLEEEVSQALRQPPSLFEAVAQEIQRDPVLLSQLEALVRSASQSKEAL